MPSLSSDSDSQNNSSTPALHQSHPFVFVIAIVLTFVLGGIVGYTLGRQQVQIIESQITASPSPLLTAVTDLIPQENTLYMAEYFGEYAEYHGENVIFFTNKMLQKWANESESVYFGSSTFINQGWSLQKTDFRKLKNPQKLITSNLFNENTGFGMYENNKIYAETGNVIYKIDLYTKEITPVWTTTLDSGEFKKYKNAEGRPQLDKVIKDKYLVLSFAGCRGCEVGFDAGTLIVNTVNGNEKYFTPKIGNIQINSEDNTFSYQNLAPTQVPCEGDGIRCHNGQSTEYKPSGQSYTEQLP